jgi:hypothetical protein
LLQPTLFVAATDSPDGGPVAFRLRGDGLDRFAGSDGQDDTSVLDLKPSQASVVSHGLQDREIGSSDGHGARFASTHEDTSDTRPARGYLQLTPFALNLLHDFCPGPLGNDADLRMNPPRPRVADASRMAAAPAAVLPLRDARLPRVGSVLVRKYRGQTLQVRVLADGFEFEGAVHSSLSAVAKAITGSHCNGYLFFQITGKGDVR